MRRLFIITALMILILALFAGCQGQAKDGTELPSATGSLSLQITSPPEGREMSYGFINVAGIVSPSQAKVNVNGIDVDVAKDGSFESNEISLNEGSNKFRIVATLDGRTVSRNITVNYVPKLSISFADSWHPREDYTTATPAKFSGRVSDQRAEVTVNGQRVEVGMDGSYSVLLELEEGKNSVTAVAKLGDQVARNSIEAIYVPSVPLAIKIVAPEDGYESRLDLVKVAGTVSDPRANVLINNNSTPVTASGAFYAYIELAEGVNHVDAVAIRGSDNVTETIQIDYHPSATTPIQPLELKIASPENNTEHRVNVLPVTGVVSDNGAMVLINGVEATVAENGSLQGYAVLEEGENSINIIAIKNEAKVVKSITVTFNPALVVYLESHEKSGVNYTKTPLEVTGRVNKAEATVTVNGLLVAVAPDGSFTAQEKLKEGSNSITAVAALGDERDEVYILFMVENGHPNPVPGYSIFFRASLDYEHKITLKAGETKQLPLTLKTKKDGPGRFSERLVHVDREYGLIPQPMPEGLDVYLEPPEFIAYPNATYNPNLVFKTTPRLAPGTYYLHFYHNLENGFYGSGWIAVTVE